MSQKKPLGGVVVPVVTPFNADETVDIGAFRTVVEHLIGRGVNGLLVAGTTGEAFTLDTADRRRVYEAAVGQAAGRINILAGTGSPTTREAEQWTALAADCGCDAAVALTPWFRPVHLGTIDRYYTDLAGASRLPLLLYHNPPRTRVDWPTEAIAALAHKLAGKVIGIKDSAHDPQRVAALRAAAPKGFIIFSGMPSRAAEFAAAGVDGVICALSNAMAADAVAAWGGDAQAAKRYGEALAVLSKAENLIALLKRVMAAAGLPAGVARRPGDTADPALLEQLRTKLANGQ